MDEYHINIIKIVQDNDNFRKVLYTGTKSQLVVMCLKPSEEIGEEVHEHVEQIFYFVSGNGKAFIEDTSYEVIPGSIVIVEPGKKHNFINNGLDELKFFTVYAPPNHIDGRIHVTKEDAEKDVEDEAFGNRQR